MPLLAESYASLVEALARRYGEPASPGQRSSPLEAVLATVLGRSLDVRRTEAAIGALRRAGLLEAGTLAGTVPTEIRDTLRDAGVTLPPAAALLLKRVAAWFASTFPDEEGMAGTAGSTVEIRA